MPTAPSRRAPFRAAAALVVAGVATPPAEWRVEFVAGAVPLNPRDNVRLSIAGARIAGGRFGRERFSIPAADILEVAYDDAPHRPVIAWLGGSADTLSSARVTGDFGGLVLIPMLAVMAVGAIVLAPVRTTHHFVHIHWLDRGEPRDLVVQVDGDDRLAILDALASARGRPWDDLPERRRHLLRRLEAGEGDRFDLDLDRAARLPAGRLEAGAYRVVALPLGSGRADLLFFPAGGEARADRIAGQTIAAIEPPPSGGAAGDARFGGPPDGTLEALRTPAATYRLARPAAAGDAGPLTRSGAPGRRFDAGGGVHLAALLVPHGGEPCVRAPVVRRTFNLATGFLYLCRNRVLFEPMQTTGPFGAGRDPLALRRSEVRSIAMERRGGTETLTVEGPGDTVVFLPVFAGEGGPDRPKRRERRQAAERFFAWLADCWRDLPACEAGITGGGDNPSPPP